MSERDDLSNDYDALHPAASGRLSSARGGTQPRFRPSDLLPWADPHIRSLVEQLQAEVREEEAARRAAPADLDALASSARQTAPTGQRRVNRLEGCTLAPLGFDI